MPSSSEEIVLRTGKSRKAYARSKLPKALKMNGDLYLLMLPVLAYLLVFEYVPMYGLLIAFQDFSAMKGIWESPWVGFDHFERFFQSYYFGRLLANTLGISLYQLAVGFPFPIILALCINEVRNKYFKGLVQTVTYAPHFLSTVVLVGMIMIFLSPQYGVANMVLKWFGIGTISFMTEPAWFKTIYVLSGIWQNMGWNSIIYLAALAGIDPQLHEAARIDGASRLQRILHVNVPGIMPTIVVLLLLQIGTMMGLGFEKAFLLQNSLNMESSDIIATYVYRTGIVEGQFSFSAAVGLFNSVINAKLTNIEVRFEMVPFEGIAEKRNLVITSNEWPDAFHTAQFPASDLLKYGSQGVFIKLNDLIDEYAPNVKKLLEQYPEIRKAITMTDGNIYSLPTAVDPNFKTASTNNKMWLNQKWLEQLKLDEPKTIDDWYNYLKAVKTTDLNGNGQPDEIPFGSVGITPLMQYLRGSWGLGNRGAAHNLVDVDPQTNAIRFIPTDPRYKELLRFIHKLYQEGLIDESIFTIKNNEFYSKGSQGLYGAMITTNPQTLMNQHSYVGGLAYKGPYGDHLFSLTRPRVSYPGSFVITSTNKHPEATVRWIDHFYGEEGIKMFFMGFKDISYKELPDGSVDYVDEIKNNPKGLTTEQALIPYVTWPGGRYPALVMQQYFKGGESLPSATAATAKVEADILQEVWPIFNYTPEENTRMQILDKEINTYVAEMEAKFIVGDIPFSDWDKFIGNFQKLGLKEYLQLYNAAYQRYLKD